MSKRASLFLCLALCGLACQSDYRFATQALYRAPLSGCTLALESEGLVKAGHDLSQRSTGSAVFHPITDSSRRPLRLVFAADQGAQAQLGERPPVPINWERSARVVTLQRLLRRAGYPSPDSAEMEEAASAIQGALAGPKGTIMKGQSQHLEVVQVTFER